MRAERPVRFVDKTPKLVLRRDVGRNRDRRSAPAGAIDRLRRLEAGLGLPRRDHDIGAVLREALRNRPAYAARRAGDDSDASGQIKQTGQGFSPSSAIAARPPNRRFDLRRILNDAALKKHGFGGAAPAVGFRPRHGRQLVLRRPRVGDMSRHRDCFLARAALGRRIGRSFRRSSNLERPSLSLRRGSRESSPLAPGNPRPRRRSIAERARRSPAASRPKHATSRRRGPGDRR